VAASIWEGGETEMLKLRKKNSSSTSFVKLLACSTACTGASCPAPKESKQYSNAGKK